MEILRTKELEILGDRLKHFPVVAILGPRQCGKTTLAKQFARTRSSSQIHRFDLENPQDLAKLENLPGRISQGTILWSTISVQLERAHRNKLKISSNGQFLPLPDESAVLVAC